MKYTLERVLPDDAKPRWWLVVVGFVFGFLATKYWLV